MVFLESGRYKEMGLGNRLLERPRDLRLSPENLTALDREPLQLLERRREQQIKRRE
jgi:hypothetical protein